MGLPSNHEIQKVFPSHFVGIAGIFREEQFLNFRGKTSPGAPSNRIDEKDFFRVDEND